VDHLRSADWYESGDRNAYVDRVWMRRRLPDDALDSTKPQMAIANTASDLTPCNMHLNEVAESVKQGVWAAGGVPYNLPVISPGETQVKPTAMLWRNLAAMAMEEMFRANPIDGLVLLGGCEKTIPWLIIAAAHVNLPSVLVPGGPMRTGHFPGEALDCGTDVWRLSEEVRAGTNANGQFLASEQATIRSTGRCNTMGTASTMAVVAEALGMTISGFAGTPAPDARLLSMSHETGRLIADMVAQGRRPSDILTTQSFVNAIIAVAAVGGSTNSVLHLLAIAGRLGIDLTLADFDATSADGPVMANLQPSGTSLVDDLCRAGGVLALLSQVKDLLHPEPITVTGVPLVEYLVGRPVYDDTVILPRDVPLMESAGIAVLRGNLAPRGAIINPDAAKPARLQHTDPAVVFDSIEDLRARVKEPYPDSDPAPDPDVTGDCVLVMCGCGPRGYLGTPEVDNMQMTRKLLEKGLRDRIRPSDARTSGAADGNVILQVAPKAGAGKPLALMRTGDVITLEVESRTLNIDAVDGGVASCATKPPRAKLRTPRQPAAGASLRRARHAGRHRCRPGLPDRLIQRRGKP